jgi:large subunit GTPase 1
MGKSGGQGKGKPKLKDRSFGKALAKTTIQGRGEISLGKKSGGNLVSVIDNSALDDFVLNAEMDARGAEVKRVHKNDVYLVQPTVSATVQSMSTQAFDYTHLEIPRKPAWTRDMTAEEVDRREKDSFLDWRRSIAGIENTNTTLKVTPFEKNIEVWRQLWRVVERSDFVVQVVDARNPLLYYTDDLKKYTSEHKPARPMMLLVNKADYLTDYQRLAWAKKFESLDIKFAFYSAKSEQDVIDEREHQRVSGLVDDKHSFDEQEDDDLQDMQALADDLAAEAIVTEDTMDNVVNALKKSTISTSDVDQKGSSTENASEIVWGDGALESTATKPTSRTAGASFVTSNERWRLRAQVLTRKQLILLLTLLPQKLSIAPQERHVNRICAGMVGYPNVGKSSVINTILGVSKSTHGQVRVAVSSTPGKTKHFQTLNVTNDLMLCDCPGLVFPSFMRSTGEMLCAGILPIHQMRDYVSAAQVLASRVPLHLLEAQYGMRIRRQLDIKDHPDRPPTASEVSCFSILRTTIIIFIIY